MRAKGYYQIEQYEIDIIAKNGKQVVAVEVKTTLSLEDIKNFIEKFKPKFLNKKKSQMRSKRKSNS